MSRFSGSTSIIPLRRFWQSGGTKCGMWNCPLLTFSRRFRRLSSSKGSAPTKRAYRMTPHDQTSACRPSYFSPFKCFKFDWPIKYDRFSVIVSIPYYLLKFAIRSHHRCTKIFFEEITYISLLAGPPGAARDYFTISLWKSPVQIDLRTLRALGYGEPLTN